MTIKKGMISWVTPGRRNEELNIKERSGNYVVGRNSEGKLFPS